MPTIKKLCIILTLKSTVRLRYSRRSAPFQTRRPPHTSRRSSLSPCKISLPWATTRPPRSRKRRLLRGCTRTSSKRLMLPMISLEMMTLTWRLLPSWLRSRGQCRLVPSPTWSHHSRRYPAQWQPTTLATQLNQQIRLPSCATIQSAQRAVPCMANHGCSQN